jgi:hypothetical protein
MIKLDELISAGLTNQDAPDFSEIVDGTKIALLSYCSSEICVGKPTGRVRKDVDRDVEWCPDCGYALFWKRKRVGTGHPSGI